MITDGLTNLFKLCLFLVLLITTPIETFGNQDGIPKSQIDSIQKLIHQYIMNNPEVIVNSLQKMQEKEKKRKSLKAKNNIKKLKNELFYDPNSPVLGNKNGDVTIVEFFDYRCGYCKRVLPTLLKAINSDPNVRLVLKEYPILGPESVLASKIALAIWLIDKKKYSIFHNSLMRVKGNSSRQMLFDLGESIGIKASILEKKLASDQVNSMIRKNYELAQAMNISGTPAFIVGEEIVPGAIDFDILKKLIKKARKQ